MTTAKLVSHRQDEQTDLVSAFMEIIIDQGGLTVPGFD